MDFSLLLTGTERDHTFIWGAEMKLSCVSHVDMMDRGLRW